MAMLEEKTALITASATGIVLASGIKIYEKITSNAYSSKDKKRLHSLKTCYQSVFQGEPPVEWQLDDKDQPTHVLQKNTWEQLIDQKQQHKGHTYALHNFAESGLEEIRTYLDGRAERTVCKGDAGDVEEQFFADFIHFFLNDFPGFRMDLKTIQIIKKRIEYLQKVLDTAQLFCYGLNVFDKDKVTAIRQVKRILEDCLAYTLEESYRIVARDQLGTLKCDLEAVLLHSTKWIYYARERDVHLEPFRIESFLRSGDHEKQQKNYKNIIVSHSGAMLREVLLLCGSRSFGACETVTSETTNLAYYTQTGDIKPFEMNLSAIDLPEWLLESAQEELVAIQLLGQHLIQLARLKKMVDLAYELTGQIGDLWAYGDQDGKASLSALLKLVDSSCEKFFDILTKITETQSCKRNAYNEKNRINAHEKSNPNFLQVERHARKIHDLRKGVLQTLQSITLQIGVYPSDAARKINERKNTFYHLIYLCIEKYCDKAERERIPFYKQYGKAPLLEKQMDLLLKEEGSRMHLPMIYRVLPSLSDWFVEKEQKRYFSFQVVVLSDGEPDIFWELGDSYQSWMNNYLIREQEHFSSYQQAHVSLQAFLEAAHSSVNDRELLSYQIEIAGKQEQCRVLSEKILISLNATRPRWRFEWRWWPLISAGFPFHVSECKFAENLETKITVHQKELLNALSTVQGTLQQKIVLLQRSQHISKRTRTPEEIKTKETTRSDTAKAILELCEKAVKNFRVGGHTRTLKLNALNLEQLATFKPSKLLRSMYGELNNLLMQREQKACSGTSQEKQNFALTKDQMRQIDFFKELLSLLMKDPFPKDGKSQRLQCVYDYLQQPSTTSLLVSIRARELLVPKSSTQGNKVEEVCSNTNQQGK